MKVLALGGCGLMGRHFVETAIKLKAFDHLTIADNRLESAQRYVSQLGHPAIDAMFLDAMDAPALRLALARYDVVVSTIGPYFMFGTRVLDAAIEAGCHYIDICDDPEPTLDMLALHDKARNRQVTALVGMGASPGIASLLAVEAISHVGVVDRVVTTWGSTSKADEERDANQEMGAALEHWIEQITGTIPSYQNGVITRVTPLQTVALQVPGVGLVKVTTVGHPEPVTLPRSFPSIRNSVNGMVFSRQLTALLKVVKARVEDRGLSIRQAAALFKGVSRGTGLNQLTLRESARLMLAGLHERVMGRKYIPAQMSAVVEGRVDGRHRVCSAWLNGEIPGGVGANTCIPTAIALQMMCHGKLARHGVFAPEEIVNAGDFFTRLAPFVVQPQAAGNVLTVQHAWL
jgi:saccharopine dehydrogenase-like NADP-dependent oxidoreductase